MSFGDVDNFSFDMIFSKSTGLLVIGFAVGLPTGAGIGPIPAAASALRFFFVLSLSTKPPHLLESNLLSAVAKFAKKEPMNGKAELTNVMRI